MTDDTKKARRKPSASDTYAARKARGMPLISVTVSEATLAQMNELAELWGLNRSEAIARAVALAHGVLAQPKKAAEEKK